MRLVFLLSLLFLFSRGQTNQFRQRGFSSHSGHAIVYPKNEELNGASMWTNIPYSEKEIDDVNFANLLSHVLGTPSANMDTERRGFPPVNPFLRPRANVFFFLDGINDMKGTATRLSSTLDTEAKTVRRTFSPLTAESFVATLFSGQPPSVHGILHQNTRQQSGETLVQSVSEEGAKGRGLSYAASGSRSLASLLSVSEAFSSDYPLLSNLAFSWNSEGNFVESLNGGEEEFELTQSQLLERLSTGDYFRFLRTVDIKAEYDAQTNSVLFRCADLSARFNLNENADKMFMVELHLLKSMLTELETTLATKIEDDALDTFHFAFSSLRLLRQRYHSFDEQTSSPSQDEQLKVSVAFRIAERIIALVLSKFNEKYANRVVFSVVATPTQQPLSDRQLEDTFASVDSSVRKHCSYQTFPHVFVEKSSAVPRVCEQLSAALPQHLTVECPAPHSRQVRGLSAYGGNETNTITDNDVFTAHAVGWFIVFFILVIAYITYYTTTNTSAQDAIFKSTKMRKDQ